jgi:cell division protein FtsI (penicillin-binding protein 3)
VALSLSDKLLWQTFKNFGIGEAPKSGLLGETKGVLRDYQRWAKIDQATISFGYGVAVSTLQLAKAYAVLADNGFTKKYSIYPQDKQSFPILKESTAKAVRLMMESVVEKGGTATQAALEGYRVAGKTGTSKIKTNGGYKAKRYYAIFSGMAPASNPRFVMTVVVREPSAGKYYGGQVAAPVFAKVMAGALRMYNIKPDKMGRTQ